MQDSAARRRHRVVIVGSGFGGLFAAQKLKRADVDVTLISRTTHHLFQPLLYQVATGVLSTGEIAPSTREVLRRQKNVTTLLGNVIGVDLEPRVVTSEVLGRETRTPYDSLILATGAGQSYFGNDHFATFAPGMKSIDDALELRARIFGAFEIAELQEDPHDVELLQTFVVVGAGPTGVEMAGQIAELAHRALVHEFRNIHPEKSRIILIDGAPAILPTFGEKLGEKAAKRLTKLGVEIKTNAMVTDVDLDGITVKYADGHEERIGAVTKIWAAGVKASPIAALVAEQAGAEVDRSGRVAVLPDLTLPGHPEVFAVGDMMTLDKLPGVAQVAIQGGRYAAQRIMDRLNGKPTDKPFHYKDKGNLATVSRFSAVADLGRFKFAGFFAWLIWLAVHLFYIIGFKKRLTTLLHWTVSFLGASRSERAVTEQQAMAREALELLGESWSAVRSTNPPAAQTPQETGADAVEAIEESEPKDDGARPA